MLNVIKKLFVLKLHEVSLNSDEKQKKSVFNDTFNPLALSADEFGLCNEKYLEKTQNSRNGQSPLINKKPKYSFLNAYLLFKEIILFCHNA